MQGLRVSGGSLRGRKLRVDPKVGVRPTSERARQAYFNIVADRIPGARFLDLYAGSGVFSFEAISRGAAGALAIDLSRKGVAMIEHSAQEWDVPVRATPLRLPAGLTRLDRETPFDLVYADPPYNAADYEELLAAIEASAPLADGALVAIEHRSNAKYAFDGERLNLRFWRTSSYGNVSISFFDLRVPNEHE